MPQFPQDHPDYVAPKASRNFHLSLTDAVPAEALQRALAAIGVNAEIVPATHLHNDIALTDRLASYTWDTQTGNVDCDDSCRENNVQHRPYSKLAPEQREYFVNRILDTLDHYRGDVEIRADLIHLHGPPVAVEVCN